MSAVAWRFSHVHIYASDPEATVDWLTRVGGTVTGEHQYASFPKMWDVTLGGQLVQVRGQRPGEQFDDAGDARRFGIDHFCLVAEDLDEALEALAANGVYPETEFSNGYSVPDGVAFLRGPDNLWIELAPAKWYPDVRQDEVAAATS